MAVPVNTFQTYQSVGNAEDVDDIISNIDPYETPFMSMARKDKAESTYTETQTENLRAVNLNNAVIEGNDAVNSPITPTVRVGNWLQISEQTTGVSTTEEAIHKYGRKSEMARALVNAGRALKKDMESIILSNQARVVGSSSVAQLMRGWCGWIVTNALRGAGGANGSATTAATDGTQRNFSEALLKGAMAAAYTAGGTPNMLMLSPYNRVNASTVLSGNSTRFFDTQDKELNATITVYRSDFGPLKIVTNRWQRQRDAFLVDSDMVIIKYLEPFQTHDLAVTGLSKRKQIWANYTVLPKNEAAQAVIADLTVALI